jgi:hypothetical protein
MIGLASIGTFGKRDYLQIPAAVVWPFFALALAFLRLR